MTTEHNEPYIDSYDRALGAVEGVRGVVSTGNAVVETIETITGRSQTFMIRTFRQQVPVDGKENQTRPEFLIFLKFIEGTRVTKVPIPHRICELIARQRESLTTTVRKRTAKRVAAERKARGEKPGFLLSAAERKERKARKARKK